MNTYYERNKEKILAKAKARYWSNGKVRQRAIAYSKDSNQKTARYLRRYGMSLEDYTRMRDAQSGCCAICQTEVAGERMCVDHNHVTGQVRALLCRLCNAALGGFRDSPELLERATEYLRRYS